MKNCDDTGNEHEHYDNTTKVVLRRVTYFLVGCIRFIDVNYGFGIPLIE